jgi:hypothetical protein
MHEAGVPILAGTDANMQPGVPANVMHGESMHHELELLVDAGRCWSKQYQSFGDSYLSTREALRAQRPRSY